MQSVHLQHRQQQHSKTSITQPCCPPIPPQLAGDDQSSFTSYARGNNSAVVVASQGVSLQAFRSDLSGLLGGGSAERNVKGAKFRCN